MGLKHLPNLTFIAPYQGDLKQLYSSQSPTPRPAASDSAQIGNMNAIYGNFYYSARRFTDYAHG